MYITKATIIAMKSATTISSRMIVKAATTMIGRMKLIALHFLPSNSFSSSRPSTRAALSTGERVSPVLIALSSANFIGLNIGKTFMHTRGTAITATIA